MHHQFVGNNADCEVVCAEGVVLATHNLGSHVSRGPRGLSGIFELPLSCYSQVCYSAVSRLLENNVFGLDVPVDNAVRVEIL